MYTNSIIEYMKAINEFNEVKELLIDRFDIEGSIVDVDFNDLLKFPSLHALTLLNLYITYKDFQIICSIKTLNSIEFINCELDDGIYSLINFLKLNALSFDGTILDLKNVDLSNCNLTIKNQKFDLYNKAIKSLNISKAVIIMNKQEPIMTEELIVSQTQYNKNKEYFDRYIGQTRIIVKNDRYDDVEVEL